MGTNTPCKLGGVSENRTLSVRLHKKVYNVKKKMTPKGVLLKKGVRKDYVVGNKGGISLKF